jgi:Flp pilus assembly protein TadG
MRQIEAAGRLSSQRRSSQQNGNAMLEPALIFLPMIAIFLGIVDV